MLHFYKAFAQGMTLEEQDAAVRAADLRVPNGTWPMPLGGRHRNPGHWRRKGLSDLSGSFATTGKTSFPGCSPLKPMLNCLFVSHDPPAERHIYRVKNPIGLTSPDRRSGGLDTDRRGKNAFRATAVLQRAARSLRGMITSHESSRIVTGRESQSDTTCVDYIFNSDVISKGYIAFIDNLLYPIGRNGDIRFNRSTRTAEAADYTTPTDVLAELARNELAKPVTTIPNCFSPENLALAGYWHARAVNEDGLSDRICKWHTDA